MAKGRRIVEEQVMVPVPRALLTVAAPPATVTQKTSLLVFGLPPRKYLELAASGNFPVKVEGKLRVARYADVEAYLTAGAATRGTPAPPGRAAAKPPPPEPQPPAGPPPGGIEWAVRRAGFVWPVKPRR